MKKIVGILMFNPNFIKGDFETAMKEVWNSIATRSLDRDGDYPKVDLEKALATISRELNPDLAKMYHLYMMLKFASQETPVDLQEVGLIGKDSEHIIVAGNFLDTQLFGGDTEFINSESKETMAQFVNMLKDFPSGKSFEQSTKVCPDCNGTGMYDDDHECLTCGGPGVVPAWKETGDNVTEEVLQELQQFIHTNNMLISQTLSDWLVYKLLMMVFENTAEDGTLGSRKFGMQTTTDYKFLGSHLLGKMEGRWMNGVAPQKDVSLYIPFMGTEFKVPIRILDERNYEKAPPAPEPKKEEVKEEVERNEYNEPVCKEKKFTTATPDAPAQEIKEDTDESDNDKPIVYTKRNGSKVKAYRKPEHIKFKEMISREYFECKNERNDTVLYISAEKYKRDEARVAYCSLAGVKKSEIKVLKNIF